MNTDRWARVKRLFQETLEQDAGDRTGYLRGVCGEDVALREEVEALLASHAADDNFLETPPVHDAADVLAADELTGSRLGPYRILRRVGRGGTGAVYLAVRDDDEFQQRVAVKVVRRGMATEELLERFRSERQILASIDHPNIAHLLDGGSTQDGLPYFVMEYIEGEPITRYCDLKNLSLAERLQLFCTVCSAVQVAHQNLVVHRDLKPGNILVTADGTPKLLDFGIAKLLNPELSAEPRDPTVIELRVMTPEFASPEQIQGRTITTASDVYSLGILLFELLTGHRPYRLADMSLHEMELVVCTTQPERPSDAVFTAVEIPQEDGSTRVSDAASVARSRRTTADQLSRKLRGDLDNVVLKALRKEPQRRYATVEQLREDIERHMTGLPIRARADTFGYRTGKFIRRHRLPVAVATTAFVLGVALLGTVVIQSRRVEAALTRAEAAAQRAEVVNEFLQGVLGAADPLEGMGRDVTVLQSVEAAVPRIGVAFANQPSSEAAVRHTIGRTFARLGRYDEAEAQLRLALQIRRRLFGDQDPEIADTLLAMGEVRYDRGDLDGAERLYKESRDMRIQLHSGIEHADVATAIDNMANVVHERGDYQRAERMYRDALAIRRNVLGEEHRDVASSVNNVAVVLHDQDRLDEAEELYRQSLALTRRALGDRHPDVATSLNNLAVLLHDRERLAEAEPLYREALAMSRELLGDNHPGVVVSINNLGSLLHDQHKYDAAKTLYVEALSIAERLFGESHARTADALSHLAELAFDEGEYEQALVDYRRSLDIYQRIYDADNPEVILSRMDYGYCLMRLGRFGEAEGFMVDAFSSARSEAEFSTGALIELGDRMIELYEAWGRAEETAQYRAVVEELAATDSGGSP